MKRLYWNKYKIYDGESVLHALTRIPFLQQFLKHVSEISLWIDPRFNGMVFNMYLGREAVARGGPITIELVNEVLKLARKRRHINRMDAMQGCIFIDKVPYFTPIEIFNDHPVLKRFYNHIEGNMKNGRWDVAAMNKYVSRVIVGQRISSGAMQAIVDEARRRGDA